MNESMEQLSESCTTIINKDVFSLFWDSFSYCCQCKCLYFGCPLLLFSVGVIFCVLPSLCLVQPLSFSCLVHTTQCSPVASPINFNKDCNRKSISYSSFAEEICLGTFHTACLSCQTGQVKKH